MSREYFNECVVVANNNLTTKGNLSTFLVSFLKLAKSLGKEKIAIKEITSLPPASSFDNPDKRVDMVVNACLENKQIENVRVR